MNPSRNRIVVVFWGIVDLGPALPAEIAGWEACDQARMVVIALPEPEAGSAGA
ncbi:MAG: hypothetical protein HYY48_06240 [Gammaproteobacteria bacterium]|nr:hypothetical protein [Gammaproteobacteria bacterium]